MSDLWHLATSDLEAEHTERRVLAARQAAASAWSFLASAVSREDFENRRALVGEQLDKAAQVATNDDPNHYLAIRVALEDSFLEDFEALHTERQAEAQRRNAHRAFLRRQEAEAKKRAERLARSRRTATSAPEGADGPQCPFCGVEWQPNPDGDGEILVHANDCTSPEAISERDDSGYNSLKARMLDVTARLARQRRSAAIVGQCANCGQDVENLTQFPTPSGKGILCLDCYADSPEGRRMPTADEVVEMWGGPVRRRASGTRTALAGDRPCPACEGRGETASESPCQRCGGVGWLTSKSSLREGSLRKQAEAWIEEIDNDSPGVTFWVYCQGARATERLMSKLLSEGWRVGQKEFVETIEQETDYDGGYTSHDVFTFPVIDSGLGYGTDEMDAVYDRLATAIEGSRNYLARRRTAASSQRTAVAEVTLKEIDGPQDGTWPSPALYMQGGSAFWLHGPTGGVYLPYDSVEEALPFVLDQIRETATADKVTLHVHYGGGTTASRKQAGWSCTREAGETMDALARACVEQTGKENVFRLADGTEAFWERGREQADGSITGAVWGMDGSRKGSFKIDCDGKIVSGPAALKSLVAVRHTAGSVILEAQEVQVGDQINTAYGPSAVVAIERVPETASYGFPTDALSFQCANGEILRFPMDATLQVVGSRAVHASDDPDDPYSGYGPWVDEDEDDDEWEEWDGQWGAGDPRIPEHQLSASLQGQGRS